MTAAPNNAAEGAVVLLTGLAALAAKERAPNITLNKYQDPTEGERLNVSIEFAEEVARQDHSLLWAALTIDPEALDMGEWGPVEHDVNAEGWRVCETVNTRSGDIVEWREGAPETAFWVVWNAEADEGLSDLRDAATIAAITVAGWHEWLGRDKVPESTALAH